MGKKTLNYVLIFFFVFLTNTQLGCATLNVSVDIYEEDPHNSSLDPRSKIVKSRSDLVRAELLNQKIAQSRVTLADAFLEIYAADLNISNTIRSIKIPPSTTDKNKTKLSIPPVINPSQNFLDAHKEYKEQVKARESQISQLISKTNQIVDQYEKSTGNNHTKSISNSEDKDQLIIDALRTPRIRSTLNGNIIQIASELAQFNRETLSPKGKGGFEEAIQNHFTKLDKSAKETAANIAYNKLYSNKSKIKNFDEMADAFNERLKLLFSGFKKLASARNMSQSIDAKEYLEIYKMDEQFTDAETTKKIDFSRAAKMAYAMASEGTKAPGFDTEGKKIIRQLASSNDFYLSQIDRLQEPADPAWRIISSKENRSKWRRAFTETTFKAQGNSSVVIVRDGVGRYRIQSGQNDPAVLLESQMRITRTVAKGAIDILASQAGMSGVTDKLLSQSTSKTDQSTATKVETDNNRTVIEFLKTESKIKSMEIEKLRLLNFLKHFLTKSEDLSPTLPTDDTQASKEHKKRVKLLMEYTAILEAQKIMLDAD